MMGTGIFDSKMTCVKIENLHTMKYEVGFHRLWFYSWFNIPLGLVYHISIAVKFSTPKSSGENIFN